MVRQEDGDPFNIHAELYGIPYINSKGYRIGNYLLRVDRDKLPFSDRDQVDLYLYELFKYVKELPNKDVDENGEYKYKSPTDFIKDFYKRYSYDAHSIRPIKYVEGGKKSKRRLKKRKIRKSKKNRTRKNRLL
jgi:hypothetical protein